ncbi:PAS domain S-box protein [uncultured Thiodictyon sp.]|uniref:hybrid sensor histidine kinase/response regulator n=1 Tax=uncultured Thiodictyon sp. TaxID=1846217 RepID=UPI0025F058AB|nr:PAS domain S-box protein [uncultured Thiodictyon sp.]
MNAPLTDLDSPVCPQRLSSLRAVAAVAALTAVVLGLLVLVGWRLDIPVLIRVLPQWATMKPNTAVGFMLAGLALWWLRVAPAGRLRRAAGRVCASLVVLLGLLTLTEWLGGWDLGIDHLLFADVPSGVPMAPAGAFCFVFSGLALLTLDLGTRPGRRPAEWLIVPPLAVAYVALVGHLYSVESLYQVAPYASVAAHTAAGFLVLGVGVLCARPNLGWMGLVTGDTAGGGVVRRLLPAVLLVPPLVGWMAIMGERAGWYGSAFGDDLVVLASVLVLVAVVWLSAGSLNRVERGQRRAEAAHRAGEERLRLFIEHAPAALAMFDREMRYIRASRRWLEDYRLGRRDLRGLSHYEVFPEIPERWRELHRRALAGEVLCAEEDPFRRADGRVQWLHWEMRPWHDGAGAIAGILVFSEDITERKQTQAALLESERRYRVLTEVSQQIVWMSDARDACTYLNQWWFDYTGLSPEQSLGVGWVQAIDPSQREEVAQAWRAGVTGESWTREIRFRRAADGQYRWHLSRALALRDDRGQFIQWMGSATDIHDRKLAELALRETDGRKDEFLATLAHELRNPLAPIRNAVEILKREQLPETTRQAAREMIDRQVSHMVRLIDDLMDASRITRGKLDLRRERVALATVIGHAVDASRPLIEAARHRLILALPSTPILLDADPVRLAQVFSNLLNNAAKYTAPGGMITVTALRDGAEVKVTVEDTGIGIAPEAMPGLFEMFSQVEPRSERSQGGLGIGLALARRLVELHGGRIEAQSAGCEAGSAFCVRLPVPADPPADQLASSVEAAAALAQGRRILVVDDNRDSAESLAMLLRLCGNAVETAYDGVDAVAAAQRYRPDAILLDLGMPKLDGYGACRRIRDCPWGRDMAIFAVTGWGQEHDHSKSEAAGFDGHLVKPVEAATLLGLLEGLQCGPSTERDGPVVPGPVG